MGKFHGTMAATTPSGSWKVMSTPPGHRHGGAAVLVHRSGVEVQDLGHHAHLATAVGDGLAHVAGLEPGQLLAVLLDLCGEPAQQAGPVGRRHRPPGRPASSDRATAASASSTPGQRHLGDGRLGRRVDDGGGVRSCQGPPRRPSDRRSASTSASNSRRSRSPRDATAPPPRTGEPGSSTASTTPSPLRAVTTRPRPSLPTAWWWQHSTSRRSPSSRRTVLPGSVITVTGPNAPGRGWWSVEPTTSGSCWTRSPPRYTLRTCIPRHTASTGRSGPRAASRQGQAPDRPAGR